MKSVFDQLASITKERINKREIIEYIKEFLLNEYEELDRKLYTVTQIFNEYEWIEVEYTVVVSNIIKYDDDIIDDFDIEIISVKRI